MVLKVEEEFLKRNPSKKQIIGVAIDGSLLSDKALQAACGFYSAARGDKLVILHVSDKTKKNLPRNLQPNTLKTSYVDKAYDYRVRE